MLSTCSILVHIAQCSDRASQIAGCLHTVKTRTTTIASASENISSISSDWEHFWTLNVTSALNDSNPNVVLRFYYILVAKENFL